MIKIPNTEYSVCIDREELARSGKHVYELYDQAGDLCFASQSFDYIDLSSPAEMIYVGEILIERYERERTGDSL